MGKDIDIYFNPNLRPASFVNGIQRYNQTFLIVKMITKCIKEEKRITLNEIVECYLEQMFPSEHSTKLGYYPTGDGRVYHGYIKRDLFVKERGLNNLDAKAKGWFMVNLGAAIIKGKLLVIPIIDIEPEIKFATP